MKHPIRNYKTLCSPQIGEPVAKRKRPNTGNTPSKLQSPIRFQPNNQSCSKPITPTSYAKVRNEHHYFKSPTTAAIQQTSRVKELEAKCKAQLQQVKRRNLALETVKIKLSEAKILSERRLSVLEQQFPHILQKLILNEGERLKRSSAKGMIYDEEIKKFAVTLHYYSPKAYDFVRDYLTLPHPSTLTSWMRSADCSPGFNIEVLDKLAEAKNQDHRNMMTDVVLQVDEMSIHKDTCWDQSQHKFVGFVDFGAGELDESEPLATSALVCMIAGLTGGWKTSIGYVLTDKVDGVQMQNYVSRAFQLHEERGFNVLSLTSDGNTANVAMFEKLGVKEKIDNPIYDEIVNYFPNPADISKQVGCIYDMVHMMKLWRNMIHHCKNITWEGGQISWRFIEQIFYLQEHEQIVAANKIGRYHIDFFNFKMKSKYALQVFSKSVADTIDFCREDLKLPAFKNSETTSLFIRKLDKCFDILNSRHPGQFGDQSPLRANNISEKAAFLKEFAETLLKMTYDEERKTKGVVNSKTKLICKGTRNRCVLGTVVTIKSVIQIGYQVLYRDVSPHKYVLTYRFCQDLLELFFNKLRGQCGRNNNPNALQLQHGMKRIWHHNLLKSTSTGNCVVQIEGDTVPGGLLPLTPRPKPKPLSDVDDLSSMLDDAAALNDSSYFYKNCLAYIAGNITRVLTSKLTCQTCVTGLLSSTSDPLLDSEKLLIARKQRGGLIEPCRSVFLITEQADVIFKELVKIHNGPPRINNLDLRIAQTVLKNFVVGRNLFPHLSEHVLDFDPLEGESHYYSLIKAIIKQFMSIRLHDYGKRFLRSQKVSMRHTLTKQIVLYRNE